MSDFSESGPGLTRGEVSRLVQQWIGVNDGYLGDFSYASHGRFWLEVCDLDVDTAAFPGTTRECFEATLLNASARQQAAVLRAILDRYPLAEGSRTPEMRARIDSWLLRLETGEVVVVAALVSSLEVVRIALDDAEQLIASRGPRSAVDRVHTALHGYLVGLCQDAGLTVPQDRPTMNQLFRVIRDGHPAFADLGARSGDFQRIAGAMASILDALNPVRNNATVAHPNPELVGEPEAWLAINTVRTLLNYLEDRRRGHE